MCSQHTDYVMCRQHPDPAYFQTQPPQGFLKGRSKETHGVLHYMRFTIAMLLKVLRMAILFMKATIYGGTLNFA